MGQKEIGEACDKYSMSWSECFSGLIFQKEDMILICSWVEEDLLRPIKEEPEQ